MNKTSAQRNLAAGWLTLTLGALVALCMSLTGCSTDDNAPAITSQPVGLTILTGGSASFTVGASGSDLTYQWTLNGSPIPSATSGHIDADQRALYGFWLLSMHGQQFERFSDQQCSNFVRADRMAGQHDHYSGCAG